jgi:hypothetical protein
LFKHTSGEPSRRPTCRVCSILAEVPGKGEHIRGDACAD